MRTRILFVLMVVVLVCLPNGLRAQTITVVQGTVRQVLRQHGADGNGTHLLIESRNERVEACLGPAHFLEANHFLPQIGDSVLLKGYRVTTMNGGLFVASSITAGGRTLGLRTAGGDPRWAGCGHDCGRSDNCDQHHSWRHGHDDHE